MSAVLERINSKCKTAKKAIDYESPFWREGQAGELSPYWPIGEGNAASLLTFTIDESMLEFERVIKAAQLSPMDAEIIRMRIVDGETLEEIAEATGISRQAIAKRIEKSLSKTKRVIDSERI